MEVLDVNKLPSPFELEWRRLSGKPWDWKLVGVSNPACQIPAHAYSSYFSDGRAIRRAPSPQSSPSQGEEDASARGEGYSRMFVTQKNPR
jgi:hypothetical protein